MDNATRSSLTDPDVPLVLPGAQPADQVSEMAALLKNLEEDASGAAPGGSAGAVRERLVEARLGVAGSLFAALRAKHAPTAAHCLRVALGCSSWALHLCLTDELRDAIEVAALLHDVGKIGVPDAVLLKPAALSKDEMQVMERHRGFGREILRGFCDSETILDTMHYAPAWFDGRKTLFDRQGDQLPLGSRMLSIVDAFDAMTTDQVYRRALSRERAIAELFECSSTQFDPELVKSFCALISSRKLYQNGKVERRWLHDIHPDVSNARWCLSSGVAGQTPVDDHGAFYEKLLESMHDGVIFVDARMQVTLWNRAAERLTGISAASILHKSWLPSLVALHDEDDQAVLDGDCPVAHTLRSGVQTFRRLKIRGRKQKRLAVDVQMVPVASSDGEMQGVALLLHDASSQVTLEQRVQSLHEKATRDPLTKVSNRAEFDRVHAQFVETHLEQGLPCSLIICDLDHFKKVNDTYGHQAGDDALVCFAALLQRQCRPGDLVARYGGEEFVILCADCDNASATARADVIRSQWAATRHPSMAGRQCTASFGVTELQGGDSPETMLRRADRALLQAKEHGRNIVVQLGSGMGEEQEAAVASGWFSWFQSATPDQLLQRTLVTAVPLKVAAEKLRGFVADHHAEIVSIDGNRVMLQVGGQSIPLLRRRSDRAVPYLIEVQLEEAELPPKAGSGGKAAQRTRVQVVIRPKRQRDRRRRDVVQRARQLLVSLKSYMMAHEQNGLGGKPALVVKGGDSVEKAQRMLSYWLKK